MRCAGTSCVAPLSLLSCGVVSSQTHKKKKGRRRGGLRLEKMMKRSPVAVGRKEETKAATPSLSLSLFLYLFIIFILLYAHVLFALFASLFYWHRFFFSFSIIIFGVLQYTNYYSLLGYYSSIILHYYSVYYFSLLLYIGGKEKRSSIFLLFTYLLLHNGKGRREPVTDSIRFAFLQLGSPLLSYCWYSHPAQPQLHRILYVCVYVVDWFASQTFSILYLLDASPSSSLLRLVGN